MIFMQRISTVKMDHFLGIFLLRTFCQKKIFKKLKFFRSQFFVSLPLNYFWKLSSNPTRIIEEISRFKCFSSHHYPLLSKHFFDIINFRNLKIIWMALHGVLLKKIPLIAAKKKFCTLFGQQQKFDWQKKNLTFAELLTNFLLRKKNRVECVIW